MVYTSKHHTFVICAYKESPYLENCIRSLKKQTVASNLIMATSTDNAYIRKIAGKYQIPLYVNTGAKGIGNDWNFGIASAETPLVTIAHQDDIYAPKYTEEMLKAMNRHRNIQIYFTDCGEIREGRYVVSNWLLRIKRTLLLPLRISAFRSSKAVKRLILSFGNPISCPAVTYVRRNLPDPIFDSSYYAGIDWEEWEKLSKLPGRFEYNSHLLLWHRVHPDSETSRAIREGNVRAKEDAEMFRKLWPEPIASLLMKVYMLGQNSNELEND